MCHRIGIKASIDDDEPIGLCRGQLQEALPYVRMELAVSRLEPARTSRSRTPRQTALGIDIQEQGEIGERGVYDRCLQPVDQIEAEPAGKALIDPAGIVKSIRQHPSAAVKSRTDKSPQMIIPRRDHQQQLGHRMPALNSTTDQQAADRLRTYCTARLARENGLDATLIQEGRELLDLGRFAGALAAFEADEAAARQTI